MDFKKGDRVMHPIKNDWGMGVVLSENIGGVIKILFAQAGEKSISLNHVQLRKLAGPDALSEVIDKITQQNKENSNDQVCKNCGQKTLFTARTNPDRFDLRWCEACFKASKRKFNDIETGKTLYIDDLRTIDGIKSRYSPK